MNARTLLLTGFSGLQDYAGFFFLACERLKPFRPISLMIPFPYRALEFTSR